MELVDVNVLVYGHRKDLPDHGSYRAWLIDWLSADRAFGMSDLVLSSFLRIVTHPRVFNDPTPLPRALEFVDSIRSRPNCVLLKPGARHWDIFRELCAEVGARGNLIPDAWFAALATESGSEWITTDRGFARFKRLKWRHPLS